MKNVTSPAPVTWNELQSCNFQTGTKEDNEGLSIQAGKSKPGLTARSVRFSIFTVTGFTLFLGTD